MRSPSDRLRMTRIHDLLVRKSLKASTIVTRLEEQIRIGKGGTPAGQLSRLNSAVLDELGYLPFARYGRKLLIHRISKLYECISGVITTNLAFGEWPSVSGDRQKYDDGSARPDHSSMDIVETGNDS